MQTRPSAAQIRSARLLLGWNTYQLAARAGVGQQIVSTYEATGRVIAPISPIDGSDRLAAMVGTLQAAGCEFDDDDKAEPGVRLVDTPA